MFHSPACRLRGLSLLGLGFMLWTSLPFSALAVTFRVDQSGYHTAAPKVAILEDIPTEWGSGKNLKILLVTQDKKERLWMKRQQVVYEVHNIRTFEDKDRIGPSSPSWIIDFSDYQVPGAYQFKIEGSETVSPTVKISDFVYWDTLKPVVRTFYLQRCGQALNDAVTHLEHSICHSHDALILHGTDIDSDSATHFKDVGGGWHDAGDYSKHTTSTSLALGKLLALYEWNAKPFQFFNLDYPPLEPFLGEVPDYLHEIKVGVDWLLSMQRSDGGFYHKVAGKNWPGVVKPEEDTQDRFLYGVTTQDTAAAAAALAIAARGYQKKDLGYAIKSLRAAEKAWRFLESLDQQFLVEAGANDTSGSGDYLTRTPAGNDLPYRVWAAAELFLATKNPVYHQYFLNHYRQVEVEPFRPQNPAMQGLQDYLLYGGANRNPESVAVIQNQLEEAAERLVTRMAKSPYGVGLRHFSYGSNAQMVEQASFLMAAYRVLGTEKYRTAASNSLHYIFGINPLGKSYVTGIGENAVQSPYHRFLRARKAQVPGLLVGGANSDAKDGVTPTDLEALSYLDKAEAFSGNEPSILYNAELAYLLGVLNDSYNAASP